MNNIIKECNPPDEIDISFNTDEEIHIINNSLFPQEILLTFYINLPKNLKIDLPKSLTLNLQPIKEIKKVFNEERSSLEKVYKFNLPLGKSIIKTTINYPIEKIEFKSKRISYEEYFTLLHPDIYARYMKIREIINKLYSKKDEISILEVGGVPGYANYFLNDFNLTIIDKEKCDFPNFKESDIYQINDKYNIIFLLDTYEHISPKERIEFIKEVSKKATELIILGSPFEDDKVNLSELILKNYLKNELNLEHKFLEEHFKFGLPNLEETISLFSSLGWNTSTLSGSYLPQWLFLIFISFHKFFNIEKFYEKFNKELYLQFNNREPSYRKFIIGSKKKLNIPHPPITDSIFNYDFQFSLFQLELFKSLIEGLDIKENLENLLKDKEEIINTLNVIFSNQREHIKNLEDLQKRNLEYINGLEGLVKRLEGENKKLNDKLNKKHAPLKFFKKIISVFRKGR